jgi:hypothetical protein
MTDQAIDRTKLPIRRPPFSGVALANAVKTSVAQIDGLSAKNLKAGLAEAQAGMGG